MARKTRRRTVWRMAAWALAALLVAGGGVLIGKRAAVEEAPLTMRTVSRAGRAAPGFAAAVTEAGWDEAWASLPQPPPRPDVDFEREWVAAAFMGEKPTGGYRITMESAEVEGREVRILVTQREPAPTDAVTMVFTYPGHWVALDRPATAGPYTVTWHDREGRVLGTAEVTF